MGGGRGEEEHASFLPSLAHAGGASYASGSQEGGLGSSSGGGCQYLDLSLLRM